MKSPRIALSLALALLLAAAAGAADEAKREKGKGPRLNPIAETMLRIERIKAAVAGLDLSEEQKQKLGPIGQDFEAKNQAIHEKIVALLTDEQKQAAKQAMDDAKQAGKSGREVYASVEAALKLTDEQKQQMEPIGKELQTLVKDTMKQVGAVLTPEQRENLEKKLPSGKKGKKPESK